MRREHTGTPVAPFQVCRPSPPLAQGKGKQALHDTETSAVLQHKRPQTENLSSRRSQKIAFGATVEPDAPTTGIGSIENANT